MSADLTGYDVFRIFNSLKLHFSGKFDVTLYGYNSKMVSIQKYEKNNIQYIFEKKAKEFQTDLICKQAIASRLVREPNTWITDISREDYIPLSKYVSSVKFFEEDFKALLQTYSFKELVKSGIVEGLTDGTVTPEFFCMFNRVLPIAKLIDEKTNQRLIWDIVKPRLTKYEPFVTIKTVEQKNYLATFIKEVVNNH